MQIEEPHCIAVKHSITLFIIYMNWTNICAYQHRGFYPLIPWSTIHRWTCFVRYTTKQTFNSSIAYSMYFPGIIATPPSFRVCVGNEKTPLASLTSFFWSCSFFPFLICSISPMLYSLLCGPFSICYVTVVVSPFLLELSLFSRLLFWLLMKYFQYRTFVDELVTLLWKRSTKLEHGRMAPFSQSSQAIPGHGPSSLSLYKLSFCTTAAPGARMLWTHLSGHTNMFAVFDRLRSIGLGGSISESQILKLTCEADLLVCVRSGLSIGGRQLPQKSISGPLHDTLFSYIF